MVNHYIDVGDPQRGGEELAVCTCGWKARVPHSDDMTSWERHVELMALAKGHEYANTWIVPDEDVTTEGDSEGVFVSDGFGGGA